MATDSIYYDGTKLLSLMDINGDKPELYMCTTNRSAGKTTFFNRMCVNRFLKTGAKFCLIYRFDLETDNCADKFFKEIGNLFFPDYSMKAIKRMKGAYSELLISHPTWDEDRVCGYAIALNKADSIKRMSHLLADSTCMLFDEFQSETNHYCNNEVEKLLSVHTSIARGGGKQVRYLPVYMLSNSVSLLNPYYTALNISSRLNDKTKFLRGDGWVLEQGYNEAASQAQKGSAFNRAFANEKYVAYSSTNTYLNDNIAFIAPPEGHGRYIVTLRYEGKDYAIKAYNGIGIVYCSDTPDNTFPYKISVTTDDHNINYVMLKTHDVFLQQMRYFFERGCFRFKNLACKQAVLAALSY